MDGKGYVDIDRHPRPDAPAGSLMNLPSSKSPRQHRSLLFIRVDLAFTEPAASLGRGGASGRRCLASLPQMRIETF